MSPTASITEHHPFWKLIRESRMKRGARWGRVSSADAPDPKAIVKAFIEYNHHHPRDIERLYAAVTRDISPELPLLPLVAVHKPDRVGMLLSAGFPVEQHLATGDTALMLLSTAPPLFDEEARRVDDEAWRVLFRHQPNLGAVDDKGRGIWHHAAHRDPGVARLLELLPQGLDTPGVPPIDAQDKLGWTPLMVAAVSQGCTKNLQALLDVGANPCARQAQGMTAAQLLTGKGSAAPQWRLRLEAAQGQFEAGVLREALDAPVLNSPARMRV
jgi:hypothetical protein